MRPPPLPGLLPVSTRETVLGETWAPTHVALGRDDEAQAMTE